ncbi:hypothetical protein IMG5_007500 [Ichthyophthirius multifiliis]|uniref:Cyclic nucleotide-binding domain-containing protein n=1 Tax=Ichthyophthirius multifiliis TaxID=5932 RepID=G0QJP9_ICHMU|nr:hypothetical protein IMG5_007500 [Ichthyophthirius multifiliis]EGR34558.1 hypothetical protein IMG5_007500 [Ichthyophthirius multifiliis]|eukprot:XP_004039862.1 hypothetical protein IMG5_007500 [Ichthyophthirius multifiliis]
MIFVSNNQYLQNHQQTHPFKSNYNRTHNQSIIDEQKYHQFQTRLKNFSFTTIIYIRYLLYRLKIHYSYANLKPNQIFLINDKSYPYIQHDNIQQQHLKENLNFIRNKIIQFLIKLFKNIKKTLNKIPLITPNNKYKLFWDFLVGISYILMFFIIPVHIAVKQQIETLFPQYLIYISFAIIILDMLVSLNTGYYSKGFIVSDRQKVILNYIKNCLNGDLIAFSPFLFDIWFNNQFNLFIGISKMLFFIKLNNVSRIFKRIEESFNLSPLKNNIISILKILFFIIFVAHIFSCGWILIGVYTHHPTQNWMYNKKIHNQIWNLQYINAYYFTIITMITVGYGDITPQNDDEMILCVITTLFACCIFAYSVNQIGNIFQDMFKHQKEMRNNLYTINCYMEKKNISQELRFKIREYLDYFWEKKYQDQSLVEENLINQLPESIKKELILEANRLVLEENPIFKENFSQNSNQMICSIIKELNYPPEYVIQNEDQTDDCAIYFIQKGKVQVYKSIKKSNGVVCEEKFQVLEKGQYFGTQSFFTGQARKLSVKSLDFCQILIVKRNDFINIIKDFSEDFERFCMIKDQLIFGENKKFLFQKCLSCFKDSHSFLECQDVHFVPDKIKVIQQVNFQNLNFKRIFWQRKNYQFKKFYFQNFLFLYKYLYIGLIQKNNLKMQFRKDQYLWKIMKVLFLIKVGQNLIIIVFKGICLQIQFFFFFFKYQVKFHILLFLKMIIEILNNNFHLKKMKKINKQEIKAKLKYKIKQVNIIKAKTKEKFIHLIQKTNQNKHNYLIMNKKKNKIKNSYKINIKQNYQKNRLQMHSNKNMKKIKISKRVILKLKTSNKNHQIQQLKYMKINQKNTFNLKIFKQMNQQQVEFMKINKIHKQRNFSPKIFKQMKFYNRMEI